MKIEIQSKNFTVTDKLTDVVTRKLQKLDKYFDTDVKAKVFCKKEKDTNILELTIYSSPNILRSESRHIEDMFSNVDIAVSKLVRQITKHKTKLDNKFMKDFNKEKEFFLTPNAAEDKVATVVKKKVYNLSPMSIDDAMLKLDLIDHDFYVFLNNQSGNVNVLYKRTDGDFGIIETLV